MCVARISDTLTIVGGRREAFIYDWDLEDFFDVSQVIISKFPVIL